MRRLGRWVGAAHRVAYVATQRMPTRPRPTTGRITVSRLQVLNVCPTVKLEELLHHPEAGIVDMGQVARAEPDREDEQGGVRRVEPGHERGDEPRRGEGGHRGRAGRRADEGGDHPGDQHGAERQRGRHGGHDVADADVDQGLLEAAPGADDEQDASDGPERPGDDGADGVHRETRSEAEGDDRQQNGQGQSDNRRAEKDQALGAGHSPGGGGVHRRSARGSARPEATTVATVQPKRG